MIKLIKAIVLFIKCQIFLNGKIIELPGVIDKSLCVACWIECMINKGPRVRIKTITGNISTMSYEIKSLKWEAIREIIRLRHKSS